MGWRSLCEAQTSRSRRDRARERDAPTANLRKRDAALGGRRIRVQNIGFRGMLSARMLRPYPMP